MQVSIKDAYAKTFIATTHERNTMDNPLAFPTYDHHGNGQQFLAEVGMTLRDFFAAKSLSSMLAPNPVTGQFALVSDFDACAIMAYKMADAMLRVRQSK